jgi:tripartite-type tricarboxylate transporter receptor subunit TctC
MITHRPALAILTAWIMLPSSVVLAQTGFPAKPISIVVPLAPGGGTETETRMYAQKILENEGYSILVENRPGAAGTIGTAQVARAAPDGHTLLQVIAGHVIAPITHTEITYDPVKDFSAIVLMSKRPLILMVHPSLPVRNVAEYIAYTRANPGKVNYATGGPGGSTHLPGAWLHHATRTEATFVHYKSTGAFLPDLYAGRVHASATTPVNALASIKSGKLRGLGVTSVTRMPGLDLPAIAETVPGYDYTSWMGFAGPKGMPAAVVNRLNRDFIRALKQSSVTEKLASDGIVPVGSTPEEFSQLLARETAHWAQFVKETGLKLAD